LAWDNSAQLILFEYLLLSVLVVWMVIRSRHRQRREMIDGELLNRLESFNRSWLFAGGNPSFSGQI